MKYLPPELKKYEVYLDNLPRTDKAVFLCRLCLLMCKAGKLRMTKVLPGDDWSMVYFETPAGYKFHVIELYLDRVTHLEILKRLLPMLKEIEQELGQ